MHHASFPSSYAFFIFAIYLCNAPVSVFFNFIFLGFALPSSNIFLIEFVARLLLYSVLKNGVGKGREDEGATLLICIFNESISIQLNSFIIHLVYGWLNSSVSRMSPINLQYLIRTISKCECMCVCVCVCVC